jgi:hypothetical protein
VLDTGESSIFSILWMPVFTGMTMLMASLRLRHSLLEGAQGEEFNGVFWRRIFQPVWNW